MVLYRPRFIEQPPHVLIFHPKVSHHCYKLASRDRYKLTNSKPPRPYSLTAGRRTFQAGNCYTLTLYDWQAKGESNLTHSALFPGLPRTSPSAPGRAGPLFIGRTLPSSILSRKYQLYSSQWVVSHTFQFSSKRAADKVTIQPAFLLTCVRTLCVT